MATRTHPLMPVGHSYWGEFAAVTQFPNVVAAPIQSAKVEVGDTAYDSATGNLYVCTTATVGAAVWASAHSPGGDRVLWLPSSTADFSLLDRDAGTDSAISWGAMPLEPYAEGLTLTTGGGSTPGVTIWQAVGVSIPATNRFRVQAKVGGRATAAAGVSPMVFFGAQSALRFCAINRLASNTVRWGGVIRNNVTTFSTYDPAAAGAIGANDNQTGYITLDVIVRQPSGGVDPAFEIVLDSGDGLTTRVGDITTSWTGGAPPHSSGWNAAWQGGGNLVIGFGCEEYAGAGSSVMSNLAILKHPMDW